MKRTVTVILLATMLLGLFSACGTAEPVPSDTTTGTTASMEIIIETTADISGEMTGTETSPDITTAQTTLMPPPQRKYTQEEVDLILRMNEDSVIADNYVLPGEDFPEGLPMPPAVYYRKPVADAYFTFGEDDSEIFVAYTAQAYGPAFYHEICYQDTKTHREYWDRVNLILAEEIVGIYAIDRKHFIVLLDYYKNGYGIGIFEDGINLSTYGYYAPWYGDGYDQLDLSYLFPAEDFVGAAEGQMDDGYVFFQSVTGFYCEDIDGESCRIVLEYEKDGVSHRRTAIYDINGIRPE